MAQDKPLPKDLEVVLQKMVDAGEPDENIKGVIEHYQDAHDPVMVQTGHELKGVVEGLIPGAWGMVRGAFYDLPKGVITDTIDVLKGSTPEFAKSFIESIASAPKEFEEATHEERGKALGKFLGGALAMKYAPYAPKAGASVVGKGMEVVGKKGGWPIRMMGAHMLGEKNPLGAMMIAAPEGLVKGGQALQEWGQSSPMRVAPGLEREGIPSRVMAPGERGGVKTGPKLALTPPQQSAAIDTLRKNLAKFGEETGANKIRVQQQGLSDLDKAIAENKQAAAGVRSAAAKAEGSATKAEQRADLAQSKVEAPAETYTPQEREMLRRAGGITDSPSKGAIPVSTIPTKVPGTVMPAPTAAPKGISIADLETTPAPKGGPIVVPANESNEAFKARMLARQATEKPTVAAAPKPIKSAPLKQNAATAENNYGITNPPTGPHTADVNRVLSPKEAGYQANIDQGNLALSRSRGLANSMRGPVADQIQQLIDRGASPLEIEAYKRRQGIL